MKNKGIIVFLGFVFLVFLVLISFFSCYYAYEKKVSLFQMYQFIKESHSDNLIKNGDFKEGLQNWEFDENSSEYCKTHFTNNLSYVEINNLGKRKQIGQEFLTTSGHVYKINFDYRTESPGTLVLFYDNVLKQEYYRFFKSSKRFNNQSCFFKSRSTGKKTLFLVANQKGDFYFTNISCYDDYSLIPRRVLCLSFLFLFLILLIVYMYRYKYHFLYRIYHSKCLIFQNIDFIVKADYVFSIVIFLLSYFIYWNMYSIQSDMSEHLVYCIYKPYVLNYNSLMKILLYKLGFGKIDVMICTFPLLLSFFTVLKYITIRYVNADYCNSNNIDIKKNSIFMSVGAFCISISTPIYYFANLSFHKYRGSFSINTWHNPTTVIMLPMALLLFWFSYKFLLSKKIDFKSIIIILSLILLNAFTKPVFLILFIPVFTFYFIFIKCGDNYRIKFEFNKIAGILIIPFLLLSIYYVFKFYNILFDNNTFMITFSPFAVIKNHLIFNQIYDEISLFFHTVFNLSSPNGLFFVIVIIILYSIKIIFANCFSFLCLFLPKKNTLYQTIYSLSYLLIAFIVYFTIGEIGIRSSHGNFSWPIIPCEIIFMVVSFNTLLYCINNKKFLNSNLTFLSFCLGSLFIHAFLGLIYIQNIIFNRQYN